jgi:aspartyl protease family protein
LTDIRAHLNPGLRDDEILLGMEVLKHMEMIQRGDFLIIRQYH